MKKSLIALAVLGAIAGAAQAQSSVTIYGIVDTGITYSNHLPTATGTGSKFSMNSGVIQGSRLGFKGTEDLGNGLKAVFQLENGFKNDTGAEGVSGTLFNRKSVVGLSGGFGTVLLGRQTDFLDDAGDMTAVKDFGSIVGNSVHNFDRLEGNRVQNSVRYNSPDVAGFTGSAIYGFGEQAGKTSGGQSFGLGGMYKNGGLGLYAGYFQAKLGATPSDTLTGSIAGLFTPAQLAAAGFTDGSTISKTFSMGGSFQAGPARLYGNWSRVKVPSLFKQDVFEIGTDYAVTAPLHLLAAVEHVRYTIEGTSTKPKMTQVNLGADYFMSKRTDLYSFVSYGKGKNGAPTGIWDTAAQDSNGGSNQTSVSVGIRHKF
ncbi:porin [Paraherbaspirillum soli]|uniref:Porin n=1 Tax=Paraherbaspirillum soli TaxID=631222 RepID=A0ABW0M5Z8_9BURK